MKKFTSINEGFICQVCGLQVPKASSGCRNHCPACLHSLHVDNNPGDRASKCLGLLEAFKYEGDLPPKITLVFRCKKCGFVGRNKANLNDKLLSDDLTAILCLNESRLY